eukprot:1166193-Amphidinium_carterae.3
MEGNHLFYRLTRWHCRGSSESCTVRKVASCSVLQADPTWDVEAVSCTRSRLYDFLLKFLLVSGVQRTYLTDVQDCHHQRNA